MYDFKIFKIERGGFCNISKLEFQGPMGPSLLAPVGSCGALPSPSLCKIIVFHQGLPFGHQGLPFGHQGHLSGHQGLRFGHKGLCFGHKGIAFGHKV